MEGSLVVGTLLRIKALFEEKWKRTIRKYRRNGENLLCYQLKDTVFYYPHNYFYLVDAMKKGWKKDSAV